MTQFMLLMEIMQNTQIVTEAVKNILKLICKLNRIELCRIE